jgi:hypothetical protein
MARGDLARAKRYTGGIDSAVATLQAMWAKEAQQGYYNNMLAAYDKGQQQEQNIGQPSANNKNPLAGPEQNVVNNLNPLILQGQQNNRQPNNPLSTPAGQNILSNLNSGQQQPVNQKNPLIPNSEQNSQPFNPRNIQNLNQGMEIADKFKAQAILGSMKNPNINPNDALALAEMLSGYAQQHYQPIPPQYQEFDPTKGEREYDPATNTWKITRTGQPKQDVRKLDENIDSNGHRQVRYTDQTGKIWTQDEGIDAKWLQDQNKNANDTKKLDLDEKKFNLEEQKSDALIEKMSKGDENKKEKLSNAQTEYNTIMASPWVKIEDLINQGLLKSDDPAVDKYGGAYVARDKSGIPHVFFTDEMLESYAKRAVTETPNQWSRSQQKKSTSNTSKPTKISSVDDYNDLHSGATYIDPDGKTRKKK